METILLFFLIPFLICGGAFLLHRSTITIKEFFLQLGVGLGSAVVLFLLARWNSMADTEYWNGRITAKKSGTESCCHCHTVCDRTDPKTGSCVSSHEECSHFQDYYWQLHVSTGDLIEDDCEGSSDPPNWWRTAYVGEPASIPHTYQNYLRADPDSLFVHQAEVKNHLPDVPKTFPEVHGRYKVDKVIERGISAPEGWNEQLREINADLGRKKQVDLVIYLTKSKDPVYADAVEQKWLYGPKNAVIVVLGVPFGTTKIEWARVVTISKVEELKIAVRDTLRGKDLLDPTILPFLKDVITQKFHRTPMAEFSYLASAAAPTGWNLFFHLLLEIAICIGVSWWVHREDVFGDQNYRRMMDF